MVTDQSNIFSIQYFAVIFLDASSCSDYESIDSAAVPITELLNRLKSAGADPSLSQNVVYAVSETVADPVITDNKEKDHVEAAELELEQTLIHSMNLSKGTYQVIDLLFIWQILIVFCP